MPKERALSKEGVRTNNRAIPWQQSYAYNHPLLFVIPTGAERLRFRGPFVEMFFDGAKRLAHLSDTEGFRARSRRTSTILVSRCSCQLSGRKLQRKRKELKQPSQI